VTAALPADRFVAGLRGLGVTRATGVPCGHLAGPWNLFDRAGNLIAAPSEGAALAIAAGWELAGTRGVVLCQNSGFGNLINPLTSLLLPYRIPVIVVMSQRGWPDPGADEPQHAVMGAHSQAVLTELGVDSVIVDPDNPQESLVRAESAAARGAPFFLLVRPGSIGKAPAAERPVADVRLPTRAQIVRALMARLDDELLVSTTGYLSRQAHGERDRLENFYMQGSMGHALAIGTGLATSRPDRRVVVLDGDGAVLMHLGGASLPRVVGAKNLVHLVVDNGCYESTGGQSSPSAVVRWTELGVGLGYETVLECGLVTKVEATVLAALRADGPVLAVLHARPTLDDVHPRASAAIGLDAIATRLRSAMISGG
jgi:phosphonopyruvate decarboxylase